MTRKDSLKDDVEATIRGSSNKLGQLVQTASGEVFRRINEVLLKPVAERHTNRVEPVAHHLVEVPSADPRLIVFLERRVGSVLPKMHDTVELRLLIVAAADPLPLLPVDPRLVDEHGADVDATHFMAGEPRMGHGGEARYGSSRQSNYPDHCNQNALTVKLAENVSLKNEETLCDDGSTWFI